MSPQQVTLSRQFETTVGREFCQNCHVPPFTATFGHTEGHVFVTTFVLSPLLCFQKIPFGDFFWKKDAISDYSNVYRRYVSSSSDSRCLNLRSG